MSTATAVDPFSVTVPSVGGELIAPGDYVGALVAMIDLGTHDNDYKGETKSQRQIYLIFELDEEDSTGKGHLVGVQYTMSLNERAGLRGMIEKSQKIKLEAGQRFEYRSLLGKSFNVLIENTKSGDRTYHKVAKDGIGPLHRKDDPINAKNQREHFTYSVVQGLPPDLGWVPYLYGRPVKDVILESKELKVAGSVSQEKAKPLDTSALATVEKILIEASKLASKSAPRDQAVEEAARIMKEAGILPDYLSDVAREVFDEIPF